jgi:putative transposase
MVKRYRKKSTHNRKLGRLLSPYDEKEGTRTMKNTNYVKNGIYHLYNRSIKPLVLFSDRDDYSWFLRKFKYYKHQVPSSIIAYTLMPNHFHFMIRQDSEVPVSKLFNMVFSVYVRHYNFKYDRKGVLLEGRTKSKPVLKDEYLVFLCISIRIL